MFKTILVVLSLCVPFVNAADLILEKDSVVIEGGQYDMIDLSGRKYVTLRNVLVKNTTGTNYYAGIKMQGAKYIWIDNCEVDGGASGCNGTCGAIKCDGASRVTVTNCKIHNCNDDGFRIYSSTYFTAHDNEIYHLVGCGTDGDCCDCNNGHSDGFQIMATIKSDVRRNLVYDITSTSCYHIHDKCRFAEVHDNIFYGPAVGLPVYVYDTEDCNFTGNTVWGRDQGSYGGMAVGRSLYRFKMYNNIIWNLNTSHMGFSWDSSLHEGDYNLYGENSTGSWVRGSHSFVTNNPGFNTITTTPKYGSVTANDFGLKSGAAAIDKGTDALAQVQDIDYYGLAKTGTYDVGAIQYGHTAKKPQVYFTSANREGAEGHTVSFTNSSDAAFTGFSWDFGDGGSSTDKNPSHAYSSHGRYTVTLTGTGSGGLEDELAVKFYVVITTGSPVKKSVTPKNILAGLTAFPDPMGYYTDFTFASGDARIVVTDSHGKTVRTLTDTRHWDGRDERGQQVIPGMYMYHVNMDGYSMTGKIVKTK